MGCMNIRLGPQELVKATLGVGVTLENTSRSDQGAGLLPLWLMFPGQRNGYEIRGVGSRCCIHYQANPEGEAGFTLPAVDEMA